jgi:hypothetical protein
MPEVKPVRSRTGFTFVNGSALKNGDDKTLPHSMWKAK